MKRTMPLRKVGEALKWSWTMPRKKSVKRAAKHFIKQTDKVVEFFQRTKGLQADYHSWCTEYAVIRLYGEFEVLMLSTLVGAINNDTETLSQSVGFDFPKHMSQDVCTYLIIGTGYFDFKSRDGLIKVIREFVPETHYLCEVVKNSAYKDSLEQLSALRNYATHQSTKAKKAALKATGADRLKSAGVWLRGQDRFIGLCDTFKKLANEIEKRAPY
jgi:hypothetical protein